MLSDDDKQWIEELLDTRLEALETRLLRGFEGWVTQISEATRSQAVRLKEYDERLNIAIGRIDELEKWRRGLKGGPPQ